jgi:ATP-dependent Zn protease
LEFVEAGHALVGALMPEYDPVAKISIIPRGQAGGLTFFAPSEERLESGLYSRSYLENQMAVALGGRCPFVKILFIFAPLTIAVVHSDGLFELISWFAGLLKR